MSEFTIVRRKAPSSASLPVGDRKKSTSVKSRNPNRPGPGFSGFSGFTGFSAFADPDETNEANEANEAKEAKVPRPLTPLPIEAPAPLIWSDSIAVPLVIAPHSHADLWSQPFAARLAQISWWRNGYDTAALSDSEWTEFVMWLCAAGWKIGRNWNRTGLEAYPANLPARIWTPIRKTEDDLWAESFAANLDEYPNDALDTRDLSDADYAALMTWLYEAGWDIAEDMVDREYVEASPSNNPPRVWVPSRSVPKSHSCCGGHSHSGSSKPKAKSVTIPRFCRAAGACPDKETTCKYVHGDTIAVLNRPCGGPRDGEHAGDAAHCSKRDTCCHLHPDQVWSEELVITRPTLVA